MTRVPFGTTASPFLLVATLRHHLKSMEEDYPDTATLLADCLYVDDLLTGAENEEEALRLYNDANGIFGTASMTLHKWASNNQSMNERFVNDSCEAKHLGYLTGVLKEFQCLMGLPEATYWLAHYCACVVFALAESAIILAFMFLYKHKTFGVVYLENADPTLLLVSFVVVCFELPLLVHLASCVTKRGVYAVPLGLVVYIVLPLVQLGGFSGFPYGVAQYIFMERSTKLLSSIYPHCALCWVLRITGLENDYTGKAGWNIITKRALGFDNVTIIEIWAVTALSSVVLVCLIWYLSRVLPWVASIPQHPLFPFMHFGQQKALDGVDIEIYEKQVTLLLGHNGAGKTTLMSILTGMLNPSGGVAVVCGYDVVKNTALARRSIGFCQQTGVFFPDLTVWEHLVYFGKVNDGRGKP
ncbi:hypothetical protein ISCGN_015935 [Ixodes scapularis]